MYDSISVIECMASVQSDDVRLQQITRVDSLSTDDPGRRLSVEHVPNDRFQLGPFGPSSSYDDVPLAAAVLKSVCIRDGSFSSPSSKQAWFSRLRAKSVADGWRPWLISYRGFSHHLGTVRECTHEKKTESKKRRKNSKNTSECRKSHTHDQHVSTTYADNDRSSNVFCREAVDIVFVFADVMLALKTMSDGDEIDDVSDWWECAG